MRIGIFGGSFNPPHEGHRKLALEISKKAELQKIIIIPAGTPPHKTAADLVKGEDRVKMCREVFFEDFFSVSDIEIKRDGKSYTVDTLRELKKLYPADELFLIMGSDMLLSFNRWYKYEEILSLAKPCVLTREENVSPERLLLFLKNDLGLMEDDFVLSTAEPLICSSSEIREKIKKGEKTDGLLSSKVREFIDRFELYSPSFGEYKLLLRELLDDYRYLHSLAVAKSARELSEIYGGDGERAYMAGLLHDIMKNAEKSFQLQIIEKGGIILNQAEKNNPALWHSIAGEAYLRDELQIYDEELLKAVRYHTTGKDNMTLLQKIIYIADYISEDRSYPDVDTMRELALHNSLESAALYSLKFSFSDLSKKERVIHPDSVDFYNELIIEQRRKEEDI